MRSGALLALALAVPAAGTLAPSIPTIQLSYTYNGSQVLIPRMLLGTGGGNGGFDSTAWLAASSGGGFDTAQTYCYYTSPKRNGTPEAACSQVAIANSASITGVRPAFVISKIEPEDFGALPVFSGFGRVFDRGILQEMSLPALDMLMFHQAGRGAAASNVRPACFDAAGAASGEGAYAKCRLATFQGFQALLQKGLIRAHAASNWGIRDLQQVFAASGTYPSALEVEVHPWWHEDALLDFCLEKNITIISACACLPARGRWAPACPCLKHPTPFPPTCPTSADYAPLALATPAALGDATVTAIAARRAISPAQVLLLWGLQRTRGVLIPRSASAAHMAENMAVFGLAPLAPSDFAALSSLPQKKIFNVYCQPWC
jgi:diketogulonate reductase-like aldo/keto reductase